MQRAVRLFLWAILMWTHISFADECVAYFKDYQKIQVMYDSKQNEIELLQALQELNARDLETTDTRYALIFARVPLEVVSKVRKLSYVKHVLHMEELIQTGADFEIPSPAMRSAFKQKKSTPKPRKFHKSTVFLIEKLEDLRRADLPEDQRLQYFEDIVLDIVAHERVESFTDKDMLFVEDAILRTSEPIVSVFNRFFIQYNYAERIVE